MDLLFMHWDGLPSQFWRQYCDLVSSNSLQDRFSYFNKYPLSPIKNDDLLTPYLDNIKILWCKNDERLFKYVMQWHADIFQNPDNPQRCALCLIGDPLCGKNFPQIPISNILRESYGDIIGIKSLLDKYNIKYFDRMLAVSNYLNIDKRNRTKLKNLISNTRNIEFKFKRAKRIGNLYARFIFTSNEKDYFKLVQNDENFCVIQCSNDYVGNEKYFDAIASLFENKQFLNSLLYYFFHLDLSDFIATEHPFLIKRPMSIIQQQNDLINITKPLTNIDISLLNIPSLLENISTNKIFSPKIDTFRVIPKITTTKIEINKFSSKSRIQNFCLKSKISKKKVKETVWLKYCGDTYKGECFCCCKSIDKTSVYVEYGHIVPKRDGGKYTIENIRPLCADCNRGRGGMHSMNMYKYMIITKQEGLKNLTEDEKCLYLYEKDKRKITTKKYKEKMDSLLKQNVITEPLVIGLLDALEKNVNYQKTIKYIDTFQ